ncbi:MAG: glucose-1-phosphate cytidylyltransferase [Oscillospiraceae bacterium]|jgi:glucose-1-phosphate cytidylyltransferase|nr:glucose-1-phosphate cytidylyltransferase [Oscillospiraceae bacterium]
MKAVILAGGYGTRISEESHLRPKPMIEIGGAPILWHIMKYYSHHGINDFIICCGYKGHMVKEYFADYYLHRSDVTFDFSNGGGMTVHNNVAEPWRVTLVDTGLNTQTGGRIKQVRKYTDGKRFLMTYGDGVSDINLRELIETHDKSGKTATLSAIQPGGRFGMLDINDRDGTIAGFHEKARGDGGWINAGFMVMEPEVFDYIEGDDTQLELEPLQLLSSGGKLGVYKHTGFWQCMDTQRDKILLEGLWESGNAPWRVWDGVEGG